MCTRVSDCQRERDIGTGSREEVTIRDKEKKCYESPKKETVSHAFKHLIQNLKSYNGIKV